jgi:glycosyltransferase involved in cell wall biosynthesis
VLVDPLDVGEIARAIARVIEDETLRAELVELGRDRLREFDWGNTAGSVLQVLQEAGSVGSV